MRVVLVFVGLLALSQAGYIKTRLATKAAPPQQQPQVSYQQQQEPIRINIERDSVEPEEDSGYSAEPSREEERPTPAPEVRAPIRVYTNVRTRENVERLERPQQQRHQQQIQDAKARKEALELEALEEEEMEREALEHAKTIKYTFATAVDDGIMDQSQGREETRDGLKVTGSYRYSDGFVKRTVHYVADQDGYRIVSEESEPIGNGPVIDLVNGRAEVHNQVQGVDTKYSIHADDIVLPTSSTESPEVAVRKSVQIKQLKSSVSSTY